MLLIIVLGASYAGVRGLQAAYAKPERDARTMAALQQAKQALLGYAANRVRLIGINSGTGRDVPGALPCPAATLAQTNVEYGRARQSCNVSVVTPTVLIGRLPFRTLEIAELTDSTGEGLWYAVSESFRNNETGMTPINVHTQGRIRLVADGGVVQQSRIVAVIMAPNAALAGQVRGSTAERHDPINYLERYTISPIAGVNFDFYAGRPTADTPPFNDYMVTITEAELFDAIENAIAQRIDETVTPLIAAHYNFWGSLPLATGSFDPSRASTSLFGQRDEFWGQLPVAQQNIHFDNYPSDSGSAWVSCSPVGGSFPTNRIRCNISGSIGQTYIVTQPLDSVGRGIFAAPVIDVSPPGTATVTVTGQIPDNDDDGQIRVQGVLTASSSTVYINLPVQQLVAGAAGTATTDWFVFSEWAKFIYYGRCTTSTSTCMTVTGLNGANSSARAAMVLAGRPIQKASNNLMQNQNPAATVATAEYLDAPHTTGSTSFQRRLRTMNVNDRVVAVP